MSPFRVLLIILHQFAINMPPFLGWEYFSIQQIPNPKSVFATLGLCHPFRVLFIHYFSSIIYNYTTRYWFYFLNTHKQNKPLVSEWLISTIV